MKRREPTLTVDEILAEHVLTPAFDEYSGGFDGPLGTHGPSTPIVGVPGTETMICRSDNHYFDQMLVHDEECHTRILLTEIERLRALVANLRERQSVIPTTAGITSNEAEGERLMVDDEVLPPGTIGRADGPSIPCTRPGCTLRHWPGDIVDHQAEP